MTAATTRRTRSLSLSGDLLRRLRRASAADDGEAFARYRRDAIAFCREVLGFEPTIGQCRILEAVVRGAAVTVRSGRGVGKSRVAAAIALWFIVTHGPGTRVVLCAPTFRQVQETLWWGELRSLYLGAREPLGGDLARLAATGLRFDDGRAIFGMTGETPEALAGVRGRECLYIVDESSGVADSTFDVIVGNCAGGGRMLLLGNPTRAVGFFRESFRTERFEQVHLSALDSPNVAAGHVVVQGLVTAEWIADRAREWGVESAQYKIHVLGEVVEAEEGRIFGAELLAAAERRWASTPPVGRLVVGVDPAGAGVEGDEAAFCARRGLRVLELWTRRGLTEDGHLVEVLGALRRFRGSTSERPLVVVDADGYLGARVRGVFTSYQSQHAREFSLYGFRGGERAMRRPREIDRRRDELYLGLYDWLREGGAIPEDVKLEAELAAFATERTLIGRTKVTGKDVLRRALGRSPDRADALALSVWEPMSEAFSGDADTNEVDELGTVYEQHDRVFAAINPYDTTGMNPWGTR